MAHLILVAKAATHPFPLYFTLVYVVGFLAAISIGLIAFFNSKRPVGWEDAQRPNVIPQLGVKENQDKSNSDNDL